MMRVLKRLYSSVILYLIEYLIINHARLEWDSDIVQIIIPGDDGGLTTEWRRETGVEERERLVNELLDNNRRIGNE